MIDEDTPVGTPVIVQRDDGSELRTSTRAQPWWLILRVPQPKRGRRAADSQRLVVLVHGISGAYDCERITPVPVRQLELFGGRR